MDVTPAFERVILPGPFVIVTPVPAVSVDDVGAKPVLPMRSCPSVGDGVVVISPDVPE
jgi:hypothetical protein